MLFLTNEFYLSTILFYSSSVNWGENLATCYSLVYMYIFLKPTSTENFTMTEGIQSTEDRCKVHQCIWRTRKLVHRSRKLQKNQRKRKKNRGFHFICPKVTEKNSIRILKLNIDELKENSIVSLTWKSS